MKYRLLALDLDGTLTNSKKEVTDNTCKVLWDYMKNGGTIVLASGRPTYGVNSVAERLRLYELGGYILSYNGAELFDCRTREQIFCQPLPADAPAKISGFAKRNGLSVLTYRDNCIYTETPEEKYTEFESVVCSMELKKVDDFASAVTFPVGKCLMTGEPSIISKMEEKMRKEYGEEYTISKSTPFFLEAQAKGIDKGRTLEKLGGILGIAREEIAAFGDSENDLPMLRSAGLFVAMENGVEELKQKASLIAPSNDEDGVAKVVSYFF